MYSLHAVFMMINVNEVYTGYGCYNTTSKICNAKSNELMQFNYLQSAIELRELRIDTKLV